MALNHTLSVHPDRESTPPAARRARGRALPYRLTLELSDRDLRHFRRELKKARDAVRIADDDEILGAASDLISTLRSADLPDFVRNRLARLETLLRMVNDPDWPLDEDERSPVLAGLAYLCDPEDLIPDSIPGIGLLDDAVMIDLVFRDVRHELEAYADYLAFRESVARHPVLRREPARMQQRIALRRAQLMQRMRRRRQTD
jgi:uncharacterized membrane protein YkvA (DUF1232 family)